MKRDPGDFCDARRRAAALFEQGVAQAGVARTLGISRVTALNWYRIWRDSGLEGLLAPSRRGRRPKLDAEQLARIDSALNRTPKSWGFASETWSLASIAALIQKLTGITHHPRHVGRLLRRMMPTPSTCGTTIRT